METNNFFLKKKYMITGGAGFIGSSLIRFLSLHMQVIRTL
jgi:nucleoside-diphosphate-sugar epimerase